MFFFSIRCSFLNNRDKTEKMYDFGFIIIFVVTRLLKTILGILNFYEVLILGLSVREKFFRTFWFFFFFTVLSFFFLSNWKNLFWPNKSPWKFDGNSVLYTSSVNFDGNLEKHFKTRLTLLRIVFLYRRFIHCARTKFQLSRIYLCIFYVIYFLPTTLRLTAYVKYVRHFSFCFFCSFCFFVVIYSQ